MSSAPASFPPLGDSNYDTWSIRVRGALVARKLQAAIKPLARPAIAVDPAIDEEARFLLLQRMDDIRIRQNSMYGTAREMWEALKASYESGLPAKRSALHREINNIRLGGPDQAQRC